MSIYKYGKRISFRLSPLHEKKIGELKELHGYSNLGDTAKHVVILAIRGELLKKDGTNLFKD